MRSSISKYKRLSTRNVLPSEAGGYWNDYICSTFVKLKAEKLDSNMFFGDITYSTLDRLMISQVHSAPQRVVRTKSLISQGVEDVYLINLQLSGEGIISQDDRHSVLRPCDWTFTDASRPYELRFKNEFKQLVLKVPKEVLDLNTSSLNNSTALRVNGRQGLGQLTAGFLRSLLKNVDFLDDKSVESSIYNLTKNLIQDALVHYFTTNGQAVSSNVMLLRIKSHILDNLCDPDLSVNQLAKIFNCTPRYLHMVFEGEPCSISGFIRERRLLKCREILEKGNLNTLSIGEIGFMAGFKSLSCFSRSFKRRFGTSPMEFQKRQIS